MKLWKVLGVAGIAGVAATGVAVARAERRRRAYTAEDARARLHARHAEATQPEATTDRDESTPARDHGRDATVATRSRLGLDDAVALTRTGDLWLFRGASAADRAIRAFTNAPVNHVGMAVVLEDLPPLMWHAELGRSLPDVWTGEHHRGAQLHDLHAAVITWAHRYGQRVWLRQLHGDITRDAENALLRAIARTDGTPFPRTLTLAGRWVRGRLRRPAPLEATYCAEVVAGAYQAIGLLGTDRPTNWYDPGRFWSGDTLDLLGGAHLGDEIPVDVDPPRPA